MRRDVLRDVPEWRVGDHRDLLHVPVVIANEPQVVDQRPEAVPAREVRCGDDEPRQVAMLLNLGVQRLGNLDEIVFSKVDSGRSVRMDVAVSRW